MKNYSTFPIISQRNLYDPLHFKVIDQYLPTIKSCLHLYNSCKATTPSAPHPIISDINLESYQITKKKSPAILNEWHH